ncbi:MAG: hypothetical protein ABR606_00845 [Vicinamibacterales bacterium]
MTHTTRLARPQDAAIARIFNEGITDRSATFETRERTAGSRVFVQHTGSSGFLASAGFREVD